MSAHVTDMPVSERPISEQFRITAKLWADLDAAANLLEETKSAVLAEKMLALGDMPVSKAEMLVKGSKDWHDHVTSICDARKKANLKKVQLEFLRMKHAEWQSMNANHRHEARLSR
jgi:hypothetical protein